MKNNLLWVSIVVSGYCLLAFIQVGQVTAQQQLQNISSIQTNQTSFTELFHEKFSRNVLDAEVNKQLDRDNADFTKNVQVAVEYESPTTILISGELITSNDLIFNKFLFQGMDLLKNQYGFKIQDVFTSGEGNKANPTKVYILLTK